MNGGDRFKTSMFFLPLKHLKQSCKIQSNRSTIISKIMNFPIFILKLALPTNEATLPPIMHAIEAYHFFALT
jgi:hypothetical protein